MKHTYRITRNKHDNAKVPNTHIIKKNKKRLCKRKHQVRLCKQKLFAENGMTDLDKTQ
jgi:hypothetical protein